MAQNTSENTVNNNENRAKNGKIPGKLMRFIKRHFFLSIFIIAVITLFLIAALYKNMIQDDAKEKPNDPKNGPAAANGFINDVYIDENGILRTQKSIRELWNELKQKGNALTRYLDSPEELAKLLSASMATDYPDTRSPEVNGQSPDDPIDWSKYDLDIDSTEVQGIVKFKRALASNEKITMTYLPPSKFQEKINKYNSTGKAEDRDEALKYFTLERTVESGSTTGGYVDVSSRSLNNDALEASDTVVDVHGKTNNLFNGQFDAVQSASFDGKYIICSANEGKHGQHGGRVFWIDIETGNVLPNYVTIGSEGNHMTGQTYDSDRKVVLVTSVPSKRLIQIDNQTKQMMSPKYVTIPHYFHVITYSPTTKELIGYRNKKLTFMKYDSSKNEYVEQRTVNLSGSFNFPLQGMSTDGQVIYFMDSTYGTSETDKFRVWVYDFQGNLIEEHKIGKSFSVTGREVEDCFCDKEGNLWLVMPYKTTKVANYKAFPIDWENSCSVGPVSTETGNSSNVGEILAYACKWAGKTKYKSSHYEELREGCSVSCSGFVFAVYKHFGLMQFKSDGKSFYGAGSWGREQVPGTKNIGKDLSKASPGDVLWRDTKDGGHVSIYLGNGKKVHSTPSKGVNIVTGVSSGSVEKIFHFTDLPTDTKAYFDPKTGEYHSSNSTSTTSSSSSTSSTTSSSNTSSTVNYPSSTSTSTSANSTKENFSKVEEVLQYACSWIGKISYELSAGGKLVDGGKSDCSHFIHRVYEHCGLMNGFVHSLDWGKGGSNGGCPGTTNIGTDMSKASPGDVIWEHYGSGSYNHVYIYMGKDKNGNYKKVQCAKTNHAQGVYISNVNTKEVDAILHFDVLPTDTNAYYDPDTGILHTSSGTFSSSVSGQDIVNEAEKYVGKLPYVWGGYSLETGADCSGFCWAILYKLGLYTGGHIWTVPFETKGEEVSSLAQAQAGDMIIYGPAKGQSTHMAIYDGNGGLIHEINESLGCKHYGTAATWGNIVTIRRFTNNSSSGSARTYNNNVFNTEESTKIYSQQNMAVKEGDDRTYRAVQSACYDGKYAICAQNKNYGSIEASSKGGRIAWFNMETGKYETSVEIGAEGGHMDGVAYDSDRNMVLKPVNSSKGNLLQIDNNTKKITGYTNMSKYCNKLTYVSTIHQLVGLDSGKFIFMSYDSSNNKYVKQKEIKLDSYNMNCGAQGIGTDGQCIYIADSGPGDSSSKYRVWTYTLDGKKVEEHEIGKVHTGSKEVESAFGDNNGNLWLALPRGVEKVLNYTTNSSETTESSNTTTSQGSFKVKVATWQENTTKVESETNPEENSSNRSYNMSVTTIPYQDIVSKYRMPFNYLWAMLLVSHDKNYTFDLADLVRNSKIEITIHDNYNEVTTKTTENRKYTYYYNGQANAQFNYSYELQYPNMTSTIVRGSNALQDTFKASATETEPYKKTTTVTNKTNTLDIALTLADTWCVKYEKKYNYNEPTTSDSTSIDGPNEYEEEEEKNSPITNSQIISKIINQAKSKANEWVSQKGQNGNVSNVQIIHNDNEEEICKCKVTQKTDIYTKTNSSSYTAEPENYTEDTKDRERFTDVYNRHNRPIGNSTDWLYEILESNEDTANMVDLTRYLINKKEKIYNGVSDEFKKAFDFLGNFKEIGGALEGNTTEERVWLALINAGFNDVAAAAAMGNLSYESGGSGTKTIKTDVVEGGYTETNGGIGMCQWTNNNRGTEGRNTQLRKYAQSKGKTWKDEETQIEFLITEITGDGKARGYASYQFMTKTYGGVTYSSNAVKNVENNQSKIDYATRAFAATFERPAESAFVASMPKRVELANYFYNKFKGKTGSGTGTINYEHAKNVFANPHASQHEDLTWHGSTVGSHAGMITAYVDAINILYETDHTLLEVYNKIISAHPNQAQHNEPVYENDDINEIYHISVSRAPVNITEVKNALAQGKVVADIARTTNWRNGQGNFFGKTADKPHTGLIFYFDGTYYHMKTSVQKNAIYTEAQLIDWLKDTKDDLIIYSRK